jgi:neutral ceramidase
MEDRKAKEWEGVSHGSENEPDASYCQKRNFWVIPWVYSYRSCTRTNTPNMSNNLRFPYILAVCIFPALLSAALKVGTAVVDISPTVTPFQLRSGPSSHVHDPLHVRAIAFENGEGRAVIAIIDAIGAGREMCDEAKAVAAKATGWKVEQMLVAGTHTHSAPKGGDTSPGRIAYEQLRKDGVAKALRQAIENLEPAKVGFGTAEEPSEVYNRRWFLKPGTMEPNPLGGLDQVRTNAPRQNLLKPAGPVDPELCVVYARTMRGQPLGLLANYALHYVGGIPNVIESDGRETGMASADYFGEFARVVPHRVGGLHPPENFVGMMSNGTSGDINNIDFYGTRPPRAPFEQIRVVATKAADAAWKAVKGIEEYDSNPSITMIQREVLLKYRIPTPDEVAQAKKLMILPRKQREAINKRTGSVATNTIKYASPDAPKTESVIVQAIRIGDQAIVSMPFEVLVEIGLEIKSKSPFPKTFTIELANGSYGYLPPPNQHKLGGYETWLGTSRFDPESSVTLTKALLEMLGELKAGS